MRSAFAAEWLTSIMPLKSPLARVALLRRRWLMFPLRRMTLPVPVMWKRLFAPLCVFIFGNLLLRGRLNRRAFVIVRLRLLECDRRQYHRHEAPLE